MKCKYEYKNLCGNCVSERYCDRCHQPCDNIVPISNGDKIRAMSDEELAKLFYRFCSNTKRCYECPLFEKDCAGVDSDVSGWISFMQQPAED